MLNGHYFDGRSPEQQAAQLWFDAHDAQFIVLKTFTATEKPTVETPANSALNNHQRRYLVRSINFGEPTKSGQRIIRFDDGGQFIAASSTQAHEYLAAHQHGGGWVANITLKWPWVAAALVGTVAVVAVFYTHGIPVLARITAPLIPVSVSQALGNQAFEQLEKTHFKPSSIPETQQAAIRQRWAAFLAKQPVGAVIPKHTLYIRSMSFSTAPKDADNDAAKNDTSSSAGMDAPASQTQTNPDAAPLAPNALNASNAPNESNAPTKPVKPIKPAKSIEIPNAMALPNGAIVLTDGLIKLLEDKPDAVMGVLAHELGHLQHRHSMRLLVEVSTLSALSAIILGDATGFITQVPLLLGALSYSREHESEADDGAIMMMRAAGLRSSELAVFFERARGFVDAQKSDKNNKTNPSEPSSALNIPDWLSSHPSDAARIEKLKRNQ